MLCARHWPLAILTTQLSRFLNRLVPLLERILDWVCDAFAKFFAFARQNFRAEAVLDTSMGRDAALLESAAEFIAQSKGARAAYVKIWSRLDEPWIYSGRSSLSVARCADWVSDDGGGGRW